MNKLVSRNPVQRFKQGKKIVKAQWGLKVIATVDGRQFETTIEQARKNGWEYFIPSEQAKFNRNYPYDEHATKYRTPSPDFPAVIQDARFRDYVESWDGKNSGLVKDLEMGNFDWQPTFTLQPKKVNVSYVPTQESQINSSNQDKNTQNPQNNKSGDTKGTRGTKSTPFYQFGKMGGWKRSMGNSISDPESLNMLKEMGMEGKSAQEIQNEINKVFGSNAVKADNKWGNQSKTGLKALYVRWKSLQPTNLEKKIVVTQPSITQTPEFQEGLRQQFIKEETPEQQTDRAIVNNVDNLQFKRNRNYNKSEIRDLIRRYGLKAYDFTGNQRKALRLYLNGLSDDTSLLTNGLEKFIVPYKQGGQLISRNPIKRFKLRTKI